MGSVPMGLMGYNKEDAKTIVKYILSFKNQEYLNFILYFPINKLLN
jgi:hypothetical protein